MYIGPYIKLKYSDYLTAQFHLEDDKLAVRRLGDYVYLIPNLHEDIKSLGLWWSENTYDEWKALIDGGIMGRFQHIYFYEIEILHSCRVEFSLNFGLVEE
jgi:hypothetical protein